MSKYAVVPESTRKKIQELWMTGKYTVRQLADQFGLGLTTIRRYAKECNPSKNMRGKYKPFTEAEDNKIIELHSQGKSVSEIAKVLDRTYPSIYGRLGQIDLHKVKHRDFNHRTCLTVGTIKKLASAIHQDDIDDIRSKIKVGDVIQIVSCKGLNSEMCNGGFAGVAKDAVVIDTSHPRFCRVAICGTNFTESKLWVDFIMEQRKAAKEGVE